MWSDFLLPDAGIHCKIGSKWGNGSVLDGTPAKSVEFLRIRGSDFFGDDSGMFRSMYLKKRAWTEYVKENAPKDLYCFKKLDVDVCIRLSLEDGNGGNHSLLIAVSSFWVVDIVRLYWMDLGSGNLTKTSSEEVLGKLGVSVRKRFWGGGIELRGGSGSMVGVLTYGSSGGFGFSAIKSEDYRVFASSSYLINKGLCRRFARFRGGVGLGYVACHRLCHLENEVISDSEVYYVSGDRYAGGFLKGRASGEGVLYKSGWRYEGEFQNDKTCGKGVVRYNSGATLEITGEEYGQIREGIYTSPNQEKKRVQVSSKNEVYDWYYIGADSDYSWRSARYKKGGVAFHGVWDPQPIRESGAGDEFSAIACHKNGNLDIANSPLYGLKNMHYSEIYSPDSVGLNSGDGVRSSQVWKVRSQCNIIANYPLSHGSSGQVFNSLREYGKLQLALLKNWGHEGNVALKISSIEELSASVDLMRQSGSCKKALYSFVVSDHVALLAIDFGDDSCVLVDNGNSKYTTGLLNEHGICTSGSVDILQYSYARGQAVEAGIYTSYPVARGGCVADACFSMILCSVALAVGADVVEFCQKYKQFIVNIKAAQQKDVLNGFKEINANGSVFHNSNTQYCAIFVLLHSLGFFRSDRESEVGGILYQVDAADGESVLRLPLFCVPVSEVYSSYMKFFSYELAEALFPKGVEYLSPQAALDVCNALHRYSAECTPYYAEEGRLNAQWPDRLDSLSDLDVSDRTINTVRSRNEYWLRSSSLVRSKSEICLPSASM